MLFRSSEVRVGEAEGEGEAVRPAYLGLMVMRPGLGRGSFSGGSPLSAMLSHSCAVLPPIMLVNCGFRRMVFLAPSSSCCC